MASVSRLQAYLIFGYDVTVTAGFQETRQPVQLTMSREPASQGCQLQSPPNIPVTLCSHAVDPRKFAHSVPAGVSPFAPFAASIVSNAAAAHSSEGNQEVNQQQWMAALMVWFAVPATVTLVPATVTFVTQLTTALGPILTNSCVWPKLKSCTASQLRKLGHSLGELVASQASVLLMTKVAEVTEETLEGHTSPE